MGERRLSRFTYDDATKTLVPGSEKVILRYMTQVFSCCHLGGSMDLDSKGNLYFATGDNTGNTPELAPTAATPTRTRRYTLPCPGDTDAPPTSRRAAASTRPIRTVTGHSRPDALRGDTRDTTTVGRLARPCGYISYADARQTSGNTNAFEGKLLRIKPMAEPGRHAGHRDDVHDPGRRRAERPEPVPADSQAVKDGKAKPEMFAMGVRNLYSIDVDYKTDKIAAAWVGPDQGTNSTTWGPAKTENAVLMNSAGNYGWPYCRGQPQGYRAKLPCDHRRRPRGARPATPAPSAAATDGQTGGGGFWDCDDPRRDRQRLAVQHGPGATIPAARADQHLVRPAGRLLRLPAQRQRRRRSTPARTRRPAPDDVPPLPVAVRRQPGPDDGRHLPQAGGRKPDAWPAYWDGRWFLADFAGANNCVTRC